MKSRNGLATTTAEILVDIAKHICAHLDIVKEVCDGTGDQSAEALSRESGLYIWVSNHRVDCTIPLCQEVLECLDKKRREHPHWLLEPTYPERFIKEIRTCEAEPQGDVLGRYFEEDKHIEVYWLSIFLWAGADRLNVSVEDLATVVLTHELAHALTDVGCDCDGKPVKFLPRLAATERPLLSESVAQYWTHYALMQMSPSGTDPRFASPFTCYDKLLVEQARPYTVHLPWTVDPQRREVVRGAMFAGPFTFTAFDDRVAKGAR